MIINFQIFIKINNFRDRRNKFQVILGRQLITSQKNPLIFNCILGKVESIFVSEIENISKFLIVSAIISNLFLMELMFR